MRYIPVEMVQEGMVLARPVYGEHYSVALTEGTTLSSPHIQRLQRLGYAGAYIEDALSAGIVAEDILPAKLRLALVRKAEELWKDAEKAAETGQYTAKQPRQNEDNVIAPVVEEILRNHGRRVDLIDLKPEKDYLYYHAANVVVLSLLLGAELGLSGVELYELGLAALLHDIGNVFIPNHVLNKQGKLTPEEYQLIQSHTERGFDYLRDHFEISIEGCMGALQHHENFDGSGYPSGLKGDKISVLGRIIAITDAYSAMTSKRPFRKMLYPVAAMDHLHAKAGSQFDPEIVRAFQRVVALYPVGSCVELDTGVRGIVEWNHPGDPEHPRIRLLNSNVSKATVVDLHNDGRYQGLHIARMMDM